MGTDHGVTFLALELLEGETLRQRLEREPLPPRRAVEYAVQLCRGLAAAHASGVVHRDLKPENLFLTRDGQLKILDFGLARLAHEPEAGDAGGGPTVTVTQPGTVMGTAGYMSPEQVRGASSDARSDIFALGVVLFEMVSGRAPFRKPTRAETLAAITGRTRRSSSPRRGRCLPRSTASPGVASRRTRRTVSRAHATSPSRSRRCRRRRRGSRRSSSRRRAASDG